MGTRHLIIVYHNGSYKIAQYGQWDGYPQGQGVAVLQFLSNPTNIERLKAGLDKVYSYNEEQCEQMNAEIEEATKARMELQRSRGEFPDADDMKLRLYPTLHRDTGAKILTLIAEATEPIPIGHDLGFAADFLFCEWMYVVDLDAGRLEVYSGPDDRNESNVRFHDLDVFEGKNEVPRMLTSFLLTDLPDEDSFLRHFCVKSSEEIDVDLEDGDEDETKKQEGRETDAEGLD